MLIATGVVVQAAAIAFALFDIEHKTDNGEFYTKDSSNAGVAVHHVVGEMILPVLCLAFLIVAFFAAIPGGVKWAGITFGLLVLEIGLAFGGHAVPLVGVLHAVNAFAIAATASLGLRAARLAAAPAAA